MPTITFLPHEKICPQGATITVAPGVSVLETALENGIAIEHACEKSCSCTTCHVIIRQGFDSLAEASEQEQDMLDRAWGLEMCSRLGCQTVVANADLVVEIPKYTINLASESH